MLYKDMNTEDIIKLQAPYIWPEDLNLLQRKVTEPSAEVSYKEMKELEPKRINYDHDPRFDEAKKLVIDNQKASPSFLQRKLRIGYNHAARLIEELRDNKVISSPDKHGKREVLIKK
jgi:S-DNA-T family DNA segregation ATPase FtsK/SpoIIIE